MSGTGKRSFTSFVRPATAAAQTPTELTQPNPQQAAGIEREVEPSAGQGSDIAERTRVVTPTGRVRTYTASRNLPGVTLRMSEARWERLKHLSISGATPYPGNSGRGDGRLHAGAGTALVILCSVVRDARIVIASRVHRGRGIW